MRNQQLKTTAPAQANWPIPAMLVGVLLLVAAPWIPSLVPTSTVWTDDDARAFSQASADLHAKSYEAAGPGHKGHTHAGGTAEEKIAAQRNFDEAEQRLTTARSRPQLVKYLVQAAGLLTAIAGIWGFVQNRRRSA